MSNSLDISTQILYTHTILPGHHISYIPDDLCSKMFGIIEGIYKLIFIPEGWSNNPLVDMYGEGLDTAVDWQRVVNNYYL